MNKAIHFIAMTISFIGLIVSLGLLSQGRVAESQYPMITILFISNLYLMYDLHQVKKALAAKP